MFKRNSAFLIQRIRLFIFRLFIFRRFVWRIRHFKKLNDIKITPEFLRTFGFRP